MTPRRLRYAVFMVLALGFASALPLVGTALAGDAFDDLSAADATREDLAKRLSDVAGRLTRGSDKVRGANVVYCSPDARSRAARAAQLDLAIARGADALEQVGIDVSGRPPEVTVVEVEVRGGLIGTIAGSSGHALLVRNGPEPPPPPGRGALPRLRERPDGLPIARDLRDASGRLRAELWRRAGGKGGDAPGLYDVLAERIVDWGARAESAKDALPDWAIAGVRGWVAAQMAQSSLPAPGHVCGAGAAPDLLGVLDPKKIAPDAASAHLARLVDVLVTRKCDVAAGARKLAGGDVTKESFEAAFGVSVADAAVAVFPSDGGEAGCEEGQLACPLCAGAGNVEIACPECAGTAAVGCTSCLGTDSCFAAGCQDGYHYYETGDKEKCGFCGGSGRIKCKACRATGTTRCHACKSGKQVRDCTGCTKGRVPCPESGAGADLAKACGQVPGTECPWCVPSAPKRSCSSCGGAGALGCRTCWGTLRSLCGGCQGSGQRIMVYDDGTVASSTKCPGCNGKGYQKCGECKGGSKPCVCSGKGLERVTSADCEACDGSGVMPNVAATIRRRRERLAPPTQEQAAAISKALEEGVTFVANSQINGAFALRDFRSSPKSRVGKLRTSSLFANADCIWTLSVAGLDHTHARLRKPFQKLREQALELANGDGDRAGTQEASLALRALVGAGAPPDDDVVKGLVELLVRGQTKDGLWGDVLDGGKEGTAYSALYAAESLWLAQRRGVKVSRGTFGKAFRASVKLFDSKGYRADDYVTGTDVCSAVALVVISKAGSLGKDAGTFDYRGLPAVQSGLAWLDRYLDIRRQPILRQGALVRSTSQGGYAAYLFAIQRLGMLLNIEILGGERWFATGARHLLDAQFSDGSWEETGRGRLNGPVRTTTSAVLFLARATPAVTDAGESD